MLRASAGCILQRFGCAANFVLRTGHVRSPLASRAKAARSRIMISSMLANEARAPLGVWVRITFVRIGDVQNHGGEAASATTRTSPLLGEESAVLSCVSLPPQPPLRSPYCFQIKQEVLRLTAYSQLNFIIARQHVSRWGCWSSDLLLSVAMQQIESRTPGSTRSATLSHKKHPSPKTAESGYTQLSLY